MFAPGWVEERRHDYANLGLTGGNLLLLLLCFKIGSPAGWEIVFLLIGITSAWAWYANLKRYRTVADTPTSRIKSAPQGYVEIVGRGTYPPGDGLTSPLGGQPCLWFRYRIERRSGKRWQQAESGISHQTFFGWMMVAGGYWSRVPKS